MGSSELPVPTSCRGSILVKIEVKMSQVYGMPIENLRNNLAFPMSSGFRKGISCIFLIFDISGRRQIMNVCANPIWGTSWELGAK